MKLKITTVGSSAGIVLPKELLARMRLSKGDVLYATELPDGIKLAPYDPAFEQRIQTAEKVMREDRTLLRKLSEN
jgi:putative addiction module antidote